MMYPKYNSQVPLMVTAMVKRQKNKKKYKVVEDLLVHPVVVLLPILLML